ncbi:MAG TPA: OmpA family protein [Gemmatimonadaceae bacterium]|nr:OmpA family protein [Gemmatimonadaceae bacterium]
MSFHVRAHRSVAVLAAASLTLSGCASLNSKEEGGIIGATGGAVIGGAIGRANGSTAKGAILGAVVGGAAGMIIGHQMDKQAEELKQNIPGAVVERVGEGIQVTFASGLLFDFDSDVVRSEARTNLRNLATSLDKYPGSELLIVGHTDSVGTDSYNLALSQRRAASAAAYLASQGVDRARVSSKGLGETEPVAGNDTDAGRGKNRRVEVAIYAGEAQRAAAKKQAPGI